MNRKTFYVQLTENNRVTDIIEYAYGDYVEVELALPLPMGILSGEYQLVGNELVYREDWAMMKDEHGNVISDEDTAGQLRIAEKQLLAILDKERIDEALGVIQVTTFGFGVSEKDVLIEKIKELRQKIAETGE